MKRILIALIVIASIILVVLATLIALPKVLPAFQQPHQSGTANSATFAPSNLPYVQGTQLIDTSGHPFLLHGAQIQSPFNFISGWDSGKSPTTLLNSRTFYVMAHDWKMNALRLPISNWIYAKDTAVYTRQLDQVVQQANAAGLFVVLDLHDDVKSGSPYGVKANLPKAEDIPFWKAVAGHFKNSTMVMFDVYNEPKSPNWQVWLHGGEKVDGATVVGFQDLVDAIRSAGAKQIIVVEPGSAGGGPAEAGGWSTIGDNTIKDPNIVYSLHVYRDISRSPNQQDAKWGPILGHYPIYYGEWAFLPNSLVRVQCRGVSHDQADGVVNNFLSYMESRHASWTAWSFTSHYLIQDWSTYAPTTLDVPWNCGDPSVDAGMGTLVKQYLTSHS